MVPVAANALGTLLENLARLILVEEGTFSSTKFEKLSLEQRIKDLHCRIGVSGDNSLAKDFASIRNNSTHAKSTPLSLTYEQQWEVVQRAVQWVDEVILWRLGYGGHYKERGLYSVQSIQPRYNLSQRDPSW